MSDYKWFIYLLLGIFYFGGVLMGAWTNRRYHRDKYECSRKNKHF
jgi:hypothetical protein